MSAARGKYVLGKEVTSSATAKRRTRTAVLSIRLTAEELAAVGAASGVTGKAVSQLVREAIKTYLYFARSGGYSITVSGPLETLSTGQVWQSGKAVQPAVELTMVKGAKPESSSTVRYPAGIARLGAA